MPQGASDRIPPMSAPAAPPAVPAPQGASGAALHFGEFVLDISNAQLMRAATVVDLPPKAFALLVFLAQRPGELVLKDTLLDHVWGRRFVSEGAVKTVVSELRSSLGDDARAPRFVQTVQGRGYRFIAPLQPATRPHPHGGPEGPVARPWARASNVPLSLPPAIGREAELEALAALTDAHRLVTVVGAAGVGKTFLALSLVARLPSTAPSHRLDGAWLIELAPMDAQGTTAETLCAAVAHALELAESAGRDVDALARALADRSPLLVMDNAEHLLGTLAPMLSALQPRVPGLRCLVTSREPLQLPGEHVFRLGPLSVPEPDDEADITRLMARAALRLFVDRVAARLPGFVLTTAQQGAAAQLCRALDGLPLALELAAARVPTLGVEGLAAQLARDPAGDTPARLQLLTRGVRSALPHQRTLRATLAWSHDLLTPAQQRVFRRLAVFRGGFTLEAAQQVCADEGLDAWAVLDALDALVEKSMVLAPDIQASAVRFGLLQSLQDYAHERLAEEGELAGLREQHLQAVARYWETADARALGDPALAWVARHAPEIDNLRAALGHAVARLAADGSADPSLRRCFLSLVGHTALLWHRAGHAMEGLRWCRTAQGLAGSDADPTESAGVDLALAHLAAIGMVLPAREGLAAARRAVDGFARRGDRVREYYALYLQHTLMCRAEPLADRSACLARLEARTPHGASDLLLRFGRSARAYEERLQGRHAAYLAFNREELARCRTLGAAWESWSAAIGLMLAEHDCGHVARALAVGREVLAEMRAAGRLRHNANRLGIWTMMLAQSGDVAGTRERLPEAIEILRSAGRLGMALLPLAWLDLHEHRPASAAWLLGCLAASMRRAAPVPSSVLAPTSVDPPMPCGRTSVAPWTLRCGRSCWPKRPPPATNRRCSGPARAPSCPTPDRRARPIRHRSARPPQSQARAEFL